MLEDETAKVVPGHNHHACAIEVAGLGILVEGRSGSGKTSLCHGLIDHYRKQGGAAIWVSDDQVLLRVEKGELIASVPAPIAGKAELYGIGIVDVANKDATPIALVVRLLDDEAIERMPEHRHANFVLQGGSAQLPLLEVPERHESQAIRLVAAMLAQLAKTGTGFVSDIVSGNETGNSGGLGLHPAKNP